MAEPGFGMHAASPRRLAPATLGALALAVAALALSGAASAERDAPAVGVDGKWHAGADWGIEPGDDLVYEAVQLVAPGNLSIASGGRLTLLNATLLFEGNGTGRSIAIEGGGTLRLDGANVTAQAPAFRVSIGAGALECARSSMRLGTAGDAGSGVFVLGGFLLASECLVASGGDLALDADASTVTAAQSDFERLDGAPAPVRLGGRGSYTLESTNFGVLHSDPTATVALFANVTFRLEDTEGRPVSGHVNGSTAGPHFFYARAGADGRAGPVLLPWMYLSPPPTLQAPGSRLSSPVSVTGVGDLVGGNSTTFVIGQARLDMRIVVDRPFDLGLKPPSVRGGEATTSGPRAFFVDLNSTHEVSVAVAREGAIPSRPVTLRVRQYEADPQSWTLHSTFRSLPNLTVPPAGAPVVSVLNFEHVFGPWGTHVHAEGPCYSTDQYFSVFQFTLEVGDDEDYGPWNNTVAVGVVAFLVEGDPERGCVTGSETGAIIVLVGATGTVAAAVALGIYLSPARVARRAARRGPPPGDPPA